MADERSTLQNEPSEEYVELSFGDVRRNIDKRVKGLYGEFHDPIYAAAIRWRAERWKQQINTLLDNYESWEDALRHGRISLTDTDDVRHTTYEMFYKLADKARTHRQYREGAGKFATTYRSVSLCNSSTYFRRDIIDRLGCQFDQAVKDALGSPHADTEPCVTLDRIVLIPDEYWPRDTQLSQECAAWWQPVHTDLNHQYDQYQRSAGIGSHVKLQLRLLSLEVAMQCRLDINYLDFGLYGDIMAGIYSGDDKAEQLTLFHRETIEMARCEASWRELTYKSSAAKDWQQVREVLDLDGSPYG